MLQLILIGYIVTPPPSVQHDLENNGRIQTARQRPEQIQGALTLPPHDGGYLCQAILHLNLTDSPLAGDLLLVGVPQLHFPAKAGVVDARERLQGLRHVLVEQGGGRSLLRVRALHASSIALRQLRC